MINVGQRGVYSVSNLAAKALVRLKHASEGSGYNTKNTAYESFLHISIGDGKTRWLRRYTGFRRALFQPHGYLIHYFEVIVKTLSFR